VARRLLICVGIALIPAGKFLLVAFGFLWILGLGIPKCREVAISIWRKIESKFEKSKVLEGVRD